LVILQNKKVNITCFTMRYKNPLQLKSHSKNACVTSAFYLYTKFDYGLLGAKYAAVWQ
jgi:hypothetical protein